MSEDLVNITIDGHPIAVPKGTLLVEAARKIGLEIPVYCYHPKMKPVGACRVCVVEVEEIVPKGSLEPDSIHLPGVYVQRMIVGAPYDKKIEFVTTRKREAA